MKECILLPRALCVQLWHSHGTLILQDLLPGEYNLTFQAWNGFGGFDRSPVMCLFSVLEEVETVNQTQARVFVLVRLLLLLCRGASSWVWGMEHRSCRREGDICIYIYNFFYIFYFVRSIASTFFSIYSKHMQYPCNPTLEQIILMRKPAKIMDNPDQLPALFEFALEGSTTTPAAAVASSSSSLDPRLSYLLSGPETAGDGGAASSDEWQAVPVFERDDLVGDSGSSSNSVSSGGDLVWGLKLEELDDGAYRLQVFWICFGGGCVADRGWVTILPERVRR